MRKLEKDRIMRNRQEYADYRHLLKESYCGTREYFFEYSEPQMAHDHKQNLSDKAMQCILRKEALPYGIYLVDCRLHNIYTAA